MSKMIIDMVARFNLHTDDGSSFEIPPAEFYRGRTMRHWLELPEEIAHGWRYQDTWSTGYREIYANATERAIFTYCEGDLDLTVDSDEETFWRRMVSAAAFYRILHRSSNPIKETTPMMNTTELRKALRKARSVGTPLIAIRTADPASAQAHFIAALNGDAAKTPLLAYDLINGILALNDEAKQWNDADQGPIEPEAAVAIMAQAPARALIFCANAHRCWDNSRVTVQGIWNLRDIFKANGATLCMLTTPGAVLPPELVNDVMMFDEPLPDTADIQDLILRTTKASGIETPSQQTQIHAIDALVGLPAFPAENVLSVSITKSGIDLDSLWRRKIQTIEQTPGLTVKRPTKGFDTVGGCDGVKRFMHDLFGGKNPPKVICLIDEAEKAFAGIGGEHSSDVKTDMAGTFLTWSADEKRRVDGAIFCGVSGTAKTAITSAAAATFGTLLIIFDFSGMQSGIVGSSGERLRAALAMVDAVSQGSSLWIGTCNSLANFSPEMRRRFEETYFFDLPTDTEKLNIWKIYTNGFGINSPRPKDTDWTGAEIRKCCYRAWRYGITLEEAARYIVPTAVSSAAVVSDLRQQADGRFLSAASLGVYRKAEKPTARKFAKEAV